MRHLTACTLTLAFLLSGCAPEVPPAPKTEAPAPPPANKAEGAPGQPVAASKTAPAPAGSPTLAAKAEPASATTPRPTAPAPLAPGAVQSVPATALPAAAPVVPLPAAAAPAAAPAAAAPAGPMPSLASNGHAAVGADKCKICHRVQHASWEATVHAKKGLDCEGCHGNGGDYKTMGVMKNPSAARAAGLVVPGAEFCRKCHGAKADAALLPRAHAHKAQG